MNKRTKKGEEVVTVLKVIVHGGSSPRDVTVQNTLVKMRVHGGNNMAIKGILSGTELVPGISDEGIAWGCVIELVNKRLLEEVLGASCQF